MANPTRIQPKISSFWSLVRRSHNGSEGFFRREDELDEVLRRRVEVDPALLREDRLEDDRLEDDRLDLEDVLRFVMRISLYTIESFAGINSSVSGAFQKSGVFLFSSFSSDF